MLNTNFSLIDYLVFALLLISSSLIGVYFWWKSRNNANNNEFLTGNRHLSMFPVTLSMVASFLSSVTILGHPAEVYQVGTQISMIIISMAIAVIITAELFLPIYYNLNLISINEYLEIRFNAKYMRMVGTIGFILQTTVFLPIILYGPALALSSVTPLTIPVSILICGTVCTLYTSLGGIRAVIWTDVLQCILMFLGFSMVIVQGMLELGGLSEIWSINEKGGRLKFFNFKFEAYNHDNIWNVLFGTTVIWTSIYSANQAQYQRYNGLPSLKKAKRVLYYNIPGLVALIVMAILCGMIIYAKYHNCDPVTLRLIERHDKLMPYYVMDTLSKYPGLPGLFVACVFSGSLSTLSSGFNSLAAVTWEDIIKPRVKITDEKRVLNITKIIGIFYGLLTIGLSFGVGNVGTVIQATMSVYGSLTGPILAIFVLAILNPYATAPGSLIGFISGLSVSLFLSFGSIVIPIPKVSLPTTTDNCTAEVLSDAFERLNELPTSTFLQSYNPEGVAKFFHISYLLKPAIGFFISIIVGSILSHFIGKQIEFGDKRVISPVHKYIFPWYKTQHAHTENEHSINDKTVQNDTYL